MTAAGFDIPPGNHPIVPIMLGDANQATKSADRLLELGVYVIGFVYPDVPINKARMRVQISAAHSEDDLRGAVEKFSKARGL